MSSIRKYLDLFLILRPHHWVKNLLVFFPLILVQNDQFLDQFFRGAEAFIVFSIAASFVYILNDVLDFQYDRVNPSKSHRPIAANKVSVNQITIISCILIVVLASLLGLFANRIIVPIVIYILGNILYSTLAKKIVYFDLLLIALFFHLRLYTGAQNMQVQLSYLHYSTGLFCFLSLASLKRYIEISYHPQGIPGRAYDRTHQKKVTGIGLFCALITTILLVKSLGGDTIKELYRYPSYLMIIVPLFMGETLMLIYKARNKKLSEDLTMLWRKDRVSQIFFILVSLILILSR